MVVLGVEEGIGNRYQPDQCFEFRTELKYMFPAFSYEPELIKAERTFRIYDIDSSERSRKIEPHHYL